MWILSELPDQTALIRFADTELGSISVARSDFTAINPVSHCRPWRPRELVEESLFQV